MKNLNNKSVTGNIPVNVLKTQKSKQEKPASKTEALKKEFGSLYAQTGRLNPQENSGKLIELPPDPEFPIEPPGDPIELPPDPELPIEPPDDPIELPPDPELPIEPPDDPIELPPDPELPIEPPDDPIEPQPDQQTCPKDCCCDCCVKTNS